MRLEGRYTGSGLGASLRWAAQGQVPLAGRAQWCYMGGGPALGVPHLTARPWVQALAGSSSSVKLGFRGIL